jgi:phosphotransferase system HPr (HPr) family protein
MSVCLEVAVTLPNRLGIHARPAAQIVKTAARHHSTVTLSLNGRTASAASLTEILKLGARQGDAIRVRAEGDDAEATLQALQAMFQDGFGED